MPTPISYDTLSLDAWNTIVKSKKSFWYEYASLLKNIFKIDSTVEHIIEVSKKVNKSIDNSLNESNYLDVYQKLRLIKLLNNLNVKSERIILSIDVFLELFNNIILSAKKHFILIDDNINNTLKLINQLGIVIVISSNTGVISGNQTTIILKNLGLSGIYKFIYSDEVGFVKPSKEFISRIIAVSAESIDCQKILHIGDDSYTDKLHLEDSSIKSRIIKKNEMLSECIKQEIFV